MSGNIRGIECALYNGKIGDLLFYLSNEYSDFYVEWCMKIDDNHMLLPQSSQSLRITSDDLKQLAKKGIWELVLHVYPVGTKCKKIETYDDFIISPCVCCLIFYDCGLLDIYIKEPGFRKKLYDFLLSIQASDMAFITDESDGRTRLCL